MDSQVYLCIVTSKNIYNSLMITHHKKYITKKHIRKWRAFLEMGKTQPIFTWAQKEMRKYQIWLAHPFLCKSKNGFRRCISFWEMTFSFQKCSPKMEMSENRRHFNYFHPDFTKYVFIFGCLQLGIGKSECCFSVLHPEMAKMNTKKLLHSLGQEIWNGI